ncbi:MAG: hypothetical protein CMLOHMNK_01909 [Steroidobacteraceae bacterium]|nr:hypothetical protein [Steroidobacteraceae bacterium]
MKDANQRARQMPVEPAKRAVRPAGSRANTLTRISLELAQTLEIDAVNRGTDPYNSSGATGRAEIWNRQRTRR